MEHVQYVCHLWISNHEARVLWHRFLYACIGALVLSFVFAGLFQSSFLFVRDVCSCDVKMLVSKVPTAEMLAIALKSDMNDRIGYVVCKNICNWLP